MISKLILMFTVAAGLMAAQSPVFTAVSGTTCNVSLDTTAKLVVVQCGITPAAPVTVLQFDPHKLEGPTAPANVIYFAWGNIAMLFTKSTVAGPLSYTYGSQSPLGQTIIAPVVGSVPITF